MDNLGLSCHQILKGMVTNEVVCCSWCSVVLVLTALPLLQVTKLCDLQGEGDSITSVCWSEDVSEL